MAKKKCVVKKEEQTYELAQCLANYSAPVNGYFDCCAGEPIKKDGEYVLVRPIGDWPLYVLHGRWDKYHPDHLPEYLKCLPIIKRIN